MAVKKTVAIVGATGKMRGVLAGEFVKAGYRLLLVAVSQTQFNRMSKYISEIMPDAEIAHVECEKEGCWEADLIILAVSRNAIQEVVEKVKEVATQKIVLCISDDKSNSYFPFSEAQELQQLLPFSKVIAAFNNVQSPEILIAGDDKEAVQELSEMIAKAGYLPLVAENLSTIKVF